MIITKLESARRQLETAVKLYFNDAEPVSIHTLTCASHEILAELNAKRGEGPAIMSDHMIKEPYKKEYRNMLVQAKNFFKHADRDPGDTLEFNPEVNEYFLLDACEQYEIATSEKVPSFIAFRAWFHSKRPHLMNLPSNSMIKENFGDDKFNFYLTMLSAAGTLE